MRSIWRTFRRTLTNFIMGMNDWNNYMGRITRVVQYRVSTWWSGPSWFNQADYEFNTQNDGRCDIIGYQQGCERLSGECEWCGRESPWTACDGLCLCGLQRPAVDVLQPVDRTKSINGCKSRWKQIFYSDDSETRKKDKTNRKYVGCDISSVGLEGIN